MPTVRYRSLIPAPADELFAWHARPGAFVRLAPPWQTVEIAQRDGSIHDGDRLAINLKVGPFRTRWLALHSAYVEGKQFRDIQIQGPFRHWVHTHRVHPVGDEASVLDDEIEYDLPGGRLTSPFDRTIVSREIRRMFRFRHLRTRNDLLRHQLYRDRERMHVAIVGSGRLAAQLSAFLTGGGHAIVASGQSNLVVDVSHLVGEFPTSPIDLRPDAAWVSVLPVTSRLPSAFRFHRQMTIWAPTVVGAGHATPVSSATALIKAAVTPSDDAKKLPWLAEDDLVGIIHSVILDGFMSGDVTVRAPKPASAKEIQQATGRVPSCSEMDVPEYGFDYLYPSIDSAVAAMTGRL